MIPGQKQNDIDLKYSGNELCVNLFYCYSSSIWSMGGTYFDGETPV